MNKIITTLFMVLAFSAPINAFATNPKAWTLSPDSIGPVKVDMTLRQAEQASGLKFNATKPDKEQAEDGSCYYVTFKGVKNLSFMVTGNKIVRINVSSPDFLTSKGAKIGDSEARVKALYDGKLLQEPHHYDEKGHYLTLIDKPTDRSIRFETNGKVVTLMYSGKDNEVHFVEDCL